MNYDVLDGIFIALIKAFFDHFIRICQIVFDVKLYNDIEVDLSPAEYKPGGIVPESHIVGWRIYNIEERRLRNEDEWLASFKLTYGFSIEQFCEVYRRAIFSTTARRVAWPEKRVVSDLKKIGIKITEGAIRSIAERLKKHPNPDVRDLLK